MTNDEIRMMKEIRIPNSRISACARRLGCLCFELVSRFVHGWGERTREPNPTEISPLRGSSVASPHLAKQVPIPLSSLVIGHSSLLLGLLFLGYAEITSSQTVNILSSNSTPPTVGMEGQLEIILPEAGLTSKIPDRHSPLLVRIAYTRPHGTLTLYDLRYIGRVPGQFDLRDYLVTTNATPATNLAAMPVAIAGVLPNPHNGWLEEEALRAPSLFGGYRMMIALIIALWVVAFFMILRVGRKPKPAPVVAPVPRAPTFAQRIRPLVERAAAGQISADEKASLERMLIAHWQRRLGLREAGSGELIARLREHAEAGALLRALEDWLHRPPGNATVQVEAVLAPYRDLPAEEAP